MRPIEEGCLYAKAFFASSHDNDQCGSNGLPLTPNSIRITGRFQTLTTLDHDGLCCYIELVRGKHEQLMIVYECYEANAKKRLLKEDSIIESSQICSMLHQILSSLAYLHDRKIVHRNLSLANIHFDSRDNVKLSDYGLYHMTEHGATVSFPIGDPVCMAPEVFLQDSDMLVEEGGSRRRTLSSSEDTEIMNPASPYNTDIWSLGIIALQIIAGEVLWSDKPVSEVIEYLIDLLLLEDLTASAFDRLTKEFTVKGQQNIKLCEDNLADFIRKCLIIDSALRPEVEDLVNHGVFTNITPPIGSSIITYKPMRFKTELRCADLSLEQMSKEPAINDDYFYLRERSFQEVYYLWKLAGGDLEATLRKSGIITDVPPISNTCNFVSLEGESYGAVVDSSCMYSDQSMALSLDQLRERLSEVEPEDYYPLIHSEGVRAVKKSVKDSSLLPLIIRERDAEYQFHRIVLFDRLLLGSPHTRPLLQKEARTDIPPLHRAAVWAVILDVQGDIETVYNRIDKITPQPIDRQIEVDIPRCHQYNQLMSSPEAHKKLKRVLKAWVASHPQYVYWQGLDSLSAPFIYLHFNNEAVAYACLCKFISKYLYDFFLKDNSSVIQEYLAVFSQLIAFHEPELSNHLKEIGFSPDLYAIPWFLTMYAHVFPLHKLFHLWDTLLLGASVFPICIGVAILQQLKSRLLAYGFNECILLFSDLPEIKIDQCVNDSVKIFCSTPKSATLRKHAPPLSRQGSPETNKTTVEKNPSAEPLSLDELKSQRTCRITSDEMMSLLTPSSDWIQSKPKLIVIDIRSPDEYLKGTIQGSVNCPFAKAFNPDGTLLSSQVKDFLDNHKYQVKVIIDSNNTHAGKFAANLVSLGYAKVCYLHRGMTPLRGSNLLVVPSPQII